MAGQHEEERPEERIRKDHIGQVRRSSIRCTSLSVMCLLYMSSASSAPHSLPPPPRYRNLPEAKSHDRTKVGHALRAAINTPIQVTLRYDTLYTPVCQTMRPYSCKQVIHQLSNLILLFVTVDSGSFIHVVYFYISISVSFFPPRAAPLTW